MDSDLLIDLDASPNSTVNVPGNGLIGILEPSRQNAVSCNGVANNAVSNSSLATDLVSVAKAQNTHVERRASPFECPVMKVKAQSVESLSVTDFNGLGILPLLGSQRAARRPQSVNLEKFANDDSSSLLSPFASPRPRSFTSLPTESLLDAEPSKLLSPFGWTPTSTDKMTINEAIQIEDVPIGDLVQVQGQKSALPDDMFDIDTLGRKQLEHSKAQQNAKPLPAVQVLLLSLPSIGSEDTNSNDTLNKGFMESISDEFNLFPTPDDSVFEEAQVLSKVFQKIATEDPCTTLGSIEDEDGSIVYDCPDWKDEVVESDCSKPKDVETLQETLDIYFNGQIIDKKGVATNENRQKSSSSFSDIVIVSPESECKSLSFSSSISTISPSPLSSGRVENMKLKARSFIGNQFDAVSLKLRASSCSSVPGSKPGPLKAIIPLGQVIKNKISSPDTLSVHGRTLETPHLKIMNSPIEGLNVVRRMSSTPKPHTPDSSNDKKNRLSNGSSMKKPDGNKVSKSEKICSSGAKKSTGTVAPVRSLSLGKLPEHLKVTASEVASANLIPPKKLSAGSPAIGASVFPGVSRLKPSPLLQRKNVICPSAMKTPSRSISTGSLASASSMKKVHSSPQISTMESHGKSNSISSKLPLCSTGRPLVAASVNSPAKHSSPLHKVVSKLRRNLRPKEMKENVHPM